jgi:hypothetical protein
VGGEVGCCVGRGGWVGGGGGDVECLRGEGGLDGGEIGRESDRGWEDGRMGKGGEDGKGRGGWAGREEREGVTMVGCVAWGSCDCG